ncbi:hypothetical protein EMIHUDRAFT_218359 [Emiliania huxleyi CCMP1516]|uniref:Endonuclease/exonuclease/phosphatase domain-containing protein n=2 Tax=Emiliania huxleyi TaxID=2903 RepID=A0A0D3I857_EMIH1|nr:hypothetical protein EMIHUDRAFT_218359 [Emiliania huxleyi CCMP1516]EOD07442.1 hypothetical protein EMIHUDRAFT_218359 [Emiliania huxleyi CCMP1516]|eukprot:XP_005759871.1 hypothetical protein EMIHUDRAFT_218359 [Emiliania huxleyi CCMP1516]
MALALATLALGAGRSLSVVSWNILAPTFAPPSRYPWVAPATLAWPKREAAIVATLGRLDADVVCLQEVEVALWDGLLRRFTSLGYSGVLQETQRQHPIANAVLFRRAALRCTQTESRSRALIAVLESLDAADSAAPLHVASVHLEAGAEKASQRFFQLRSLLRRLTLLQQRDEKAHATRRAPPPPALRLATLPRSAGAERTTGGSSAYGESVPLAGSPQPKAMPSETHPSDHLPVGAWPATAAAGLPRRDGLTRRRMGE